METLANHAAQAIMNYRANPVIMKFVTDEALEKVAEEIRAKTGGGTTAKGADMLSIRHKDIDKRIDDYVDAGLLGCYMAAMGTLKV
jgi:hypothetical protein